MNYKQVKDGEAVEGLPLLDDEEIVTDAINKTYNFNSNQKLNCVSFIDEIIKALNPKMIFNLKSVKELLKIYKARPLVKIVDDNETLNRSMDNLLPIVAYQLLYISDKIGYRLLCKYDKLYFYTGQSYNNMDRQDGTNAELDLFIAIINECFTTNEIKRIEDFKRIFYNISRGIYNMKIKNYLALKNCVLAIDNGKITKYKLNKNLFVTSYADYEYQENATCPMFEGFLDKVLPNKNMQMVLQEFIGYCLSDGFSLEKMLVLYGKGGNGKSVFQDIITAMFGRENVTKYGLDELIGGNHHDNARYTAFNKLINIGSEIGFVRDGSMDILKRMVSNEEVTVREMREKPFNVKWKPKLLFNANNMPTAEITNAYERRLLIIPFNVTINNDEKDPLLASKIINKELSGVLNWAINGMRRIITNGYKFTKCEEIEVSTKKHIDETNNIITFLVDYGITPAPETGELYYLKDLMERYLHYVKFEVGGAPRLYKNFVETLRMNKFKIVLDSKKTKMVFAKLPKDTPLIPRFVKWHEEK